ncbi:hypothetical protein PF003_g15489 [Phytophthora fragariae]|nr:hypothetical protein PF003_g15489 [Phytophthora fragariae]
MRIVKQSVGTGWAAYRSMENLAGGTTGLAMPGKRKADALPRRAAQ